MGAYFHWNNLLYGELSAYRTANRAFSILRAGVPEEERVALKGYNPYWRLALERGWGEGTHSAMIGTYGMVVNQYPDQLNPFGPTDRFRDIAFDAQYQYITDKHRFSAQANWIHEKQNWNAKFPLGETGNPSNNLQTFKGKLTYYYERKYGVNLGYFSTSGDADTVLYPGDPITGSATGSPKTAGYIVELNYLPMRDIRLMLQYTAYTKFNGARNDYDGFGRNAKDNNTMYLLAWFMF